MREGRRRPSLPEGIYDVYQTKVGRNEGGAPAPLVVSEGVGGGES